MPSKMSNRVSSAAKRASSRVSKGVAKSVKSVKSMSSEKIVIGVLLVILVGLVLYYVNQNRSEGFTEASEPVVVYLFYVDWCPHCKTAKPKMAEVQKNLAKNNNKVNGNTVQIELVNCEGSEEERNLAKNNDVKAYPTIVATKNGSKIAEYENNITVDNLEKWISEHA